MSDISGSWLGTYWQQGLPTRFEASLVQGGKTLSGSVLDDNWMGEASITGEVVGRVIQFTKRYVANPSALVNYTGQVAEDEQSMRGTWQIQGFDAGQWEAQRSGEDLLADLQATQSRNLSLTK